MRMTLRVNGNARDVDASPDTPLSSVLRDGLGLWGTRVGCARGQCGSCMILVDGRATPSCTVLASEAAGHDIVTIEGLSDPASRALQEAFVAEDALQCGFCTSGLIVAAAALLRDRHRPGEDEIRNALDRHLCRCGVQLRVMRAVQRAAESVSP